MITQGRKSICSIDGIDQEYLKRIVIQEDDQCKWSIVSKGRQQTPFFTNEFNYYVYNDRSFMFLGEVDGKKDIYCVVGYNKKDVDFLYKSDTDGDVDYIQKLDERRYLVKTSRGAFLFDSLLFGRVSDTFDSLFPIDNHLVFRKTLTHNDMVYTFYGELKLDGTIKRNIYDEADNLSFMTPKTKDPEGDFEIIDEDKLEEEIEDLERKRGRSFKTKMKTLFKINLES